MTRRARTRRLLSAQRGFTLLEIMVVVVLIGILVGLFTLSIGALSEDEELEHLRRLEALLALAAEEAGIQGREFGLRFYRDGYEFLVREVRSDSKGELVSGWFPVEGDRFLRARNLGDELVLDLELGGEEVELVAADDVDADERGPDELEPHVYLLSSGGLEPPFRVQLRRPFELDGVALAVARDGSAERVVEDGP